MRGPSSDSNDHTRCDTQSSPNHNIDNGAVYNIICMKYTLLYIIKKHENSSTNVNNQFMMPNLSTIYHRTGFNCVV